MTMKLMKGCACFGLVAVDAIEETESCTRLVGGSCQNCNGGMECDSRYTSWEKFFLASMRMELGWALYVAVTAAIQSPHGWERSNDFGAWARHQLPSSWMCWPPRSCQQKECIRPRPDRGLYFSTLKQNFTILITV